MTTGQSRGGMRVNGVDKSIRLKNSIMQFACAFIHLSLKPNFYYSGIFMYDKLFIGGVFIFIL